MREHKWGPFFSYMGAKFRAAKWYPPPRHGTIVEPFAGAAGYSTYWARSGRKVLLYDLCPRIVGIWSYLIRTPAEEILRLPLNVRDVRDLSCCEEAKWLIASNIVKGSEQGPYKNLASSHGESDTISAIACYGWSIGTRYRVASQVGSIRHWEVRQASYADVPDREATWFVDPPYQRAGKGYKYHDVDYPALAEWVRGRSGQVIACGDDADDWLPFRPFRIFSAMQGSGRRGKSVEVIWTNDRDE